MPERATPTTADRSGGNRATSRIASATNCFVAMNRGRSRHGCQRGRPRTAEVLREIVVKIGTETGWGYTRVMGEMKKLGIKPPSRSTVQRILKAHKLDPEPKGNGIWNQFLQMHANTLWQCDFFSKDMWTPRGVWRFKLWPTLVFMRDGAIVHQLVRPSDAEIDEGFRQVIGEVLRQIGN